MKRTTAILAAVLMGSAMTSYPAFAQSSNGGGDNTMNSGASTDKTTVDENAGGAMKSDDSMASGDQMSNDSQMSSADTMGMLKTADADSIKVVKMSGKANTDHSNNQGTPPTDTTPEEQAKIQAAITANPKLTSMLQSQGLSASDIIAAHANGDKTVTLYTK